MSSGSVPRTKAAARILRYARRRAGLTQRELAATSGMPQETIARIESARTIPRYDTLVHLLDACGLELELVPRLGVGEDRTLIQWTLSMDPATRLAHGKQAAEGMAYLRKAWNNARDAARGQ
jgi:transcriptional regulator with XRE-family HTH domain